MKHQERYGTCLCELSVHANGECIRKLRYFRRDWFTVIIDPGYDDLRLFAGKLIRRPRASRYLIAGKTLTRLHQDVVESSMIR